MFPDDFKLACVIPIPKALFPKSLNDFRRIFLLTVFAKLFEKILQKKCQVF